jgi:hypothetical protein
MIKRVLGEILQELAERLGAVQDAARNQSLNLFQMPVILSHARS